MVFPETAPGRCFRPECDFRLAGPPRWGIVGGISCCYCLYDLVAYVVASPGEPLLYIQSSLAGFISFFFFFWVSKAERLGVRGVCEGL